MWVLTLRSSKLILVLVILALLMIPMSIGSEPQKITLKQAHYERMTRYGFIVTSDDRIILGTGGSNDR